jgi:uncharacterized membrane protein YphA (DoxX/SURF4 family)
VNGLLWVAQEGLALVFLFAGIAKLTMPIEVMTEQVPLPGLFLRFIAVAEVLGALGLILPGLTRMRTELTPLAALGLVIIMIGATSITLATSDPAAALFPCGVGVVAAAVAYGRRPRPAVMTTSRLAARPTP